MDHASSPVKDKHSREVTERKNVSKDTKEPAF